MTAFKNLLNKGIISKATSNAQLQKKIANHLGLNYSIINKSVIINHGGYSCGYVNIIINGNWNKKINFNLNTLK